MNPLTSDKKILMIPGPTELHPEVLAELARPLSPHYGKEWGEVYQETLNLLKKIFMTSNDVIILPAPGTAAMEMAAYNIIEPGDKVVCTDNGFFSERMVEVVQSHQARAISLTSEYGEAVSPEQLKRVLEENPDIRAFFAIHNESSTGVLNPIWEYGKITKKHGVLYVVDAVSSFGAIDLRVDEWGIDYCVGYPSKGLASLPGAIPIAISKTIDDRVTQRKDSPHSWFFNLKTWRWYIENWASVGHPFPTTMPTHTILALRKAVTLALEEGLENRYLRHREMARIFRRGIKAMKLELLAREDCASPTVTAVKTPPEINQKLIELLLDQYNLMISGGLSKQARRIVRVGHMGTTASFRYISYALSCIEAGLASLNYKVPSGAAMTTAIQELGNSSAR